MKKTTKKKRYLDPYKDYVYNNPRADQQIGGMDDKITNEIKSKMLYDSSKTDLRKRMSDAYQKRKRRKKIEKLDRINTHWKGLEGYSLNSQYDDISSLLRSLRFTTPKPKTFSEFRKETDLRIRGII